MLRPNQHALLTVRSHLNGVGYVLWGSFLLFLTAQVSIPLEPVPITLQTFGVMLIALTFERRAAIYAILCYLGLGALGAPVFANFHGGFPIIIGATGGYLLGFLFAVAVMSALKRYLTNHNLLAVTCNCLVGTIIIYACGIGWLSRFMSFKEALQVGFIPFIIPGVIKALLLAFSVRYIKVGRIRF